MRLVWMFLLLSAAILHAATVRGVVLENLTGKPLARTRVTLKGIQAYGVAEFSMHTNSGGQFAFSLLNAGVYVLRASRPGFATLEYGQKNWDAAGLPFKVEQDGSPFLELRMRRLGAVTGVVWDENLVGIPEVDVTAYRASRPPKVAGKGRTDDRGVYRIGGLEPGPYLIRTHARQLDGGPAVLPTFYNESASVEGARAIDVVLEEQVPEINFRPHFGTLCRLSGVAGYSSGPVSVSVVSDMGPVSGGSDASGRFSFENLSPGTYEILAQGSSSNRGPVASYRRFVLDRDSEISLDLRPLPRMVVSFEDKQGQRVDPGAITVLVRRKNLSGEGTPQHLSFQRGPMELPPGVWQVSVVTPPDYYPVSITATAQPLASDRRGDEWSEFLLTAGQLDLRVSLSSKPATLAGTVANPGNETVAGAPVYLEILDPRTRRRVMDLRKTLTDLRGRYRFTGLPPGLYRVLSSFDSTDPDEAAMEAARPKEVSLREGDSTVQDLALYVKP